MKRVVGIAEMKITKVAASELITYSLGSCLGVSFHDRSANVGGLIHCMLPVSLMDKEKAVKNPSMFIDTGILAMLNKLFAMGATRKNLVIKAAGGASVLNNGNRFRIGERNFTVLRKVLWKNNLILKSHDVGGNISRTMILRMNTGETYLKINGMEVLL